MKGVKNLNHPFTLKTVNSKLIIDQKCLFNVFGEDSDFYILPTLKSFDGIIGYDFVRQIDGVIDTKNEVVIYNSGIEPLKFRTCAEINQLEIPDNLPSYVKECFYKILGDIKNVFADANVKLSYNTNIVATIKTTSSDPVYSKGYPYPIAVGEFVNKEIQELLENGIIRPSRSPYNNPVWVVDKKGFEENGQKKKRLVIDFRKLNNITVNDKYPIPDTSVILSNLGNAKYFSTLDLKAGFHQILLHERDREKTAFSINNGKYEFCRMPFGLKNAPGIFQRTIDDVLRQRIGKTCHVYVDDIIIFSGNEEDHLKHIEEILILLNDANMKVNLEKSVFFKEEVEFLGFVVSREGLKTAPEKVKTILEYEEPKTVRGLRAFLGLSGYYRKFIKGYADIAKPLTKLLRGENGNVSASKSKVMPIRLDADGLKAFQKLKEILISENITLLYPDFNKPFDLTTDASSQAIGAVLSQNNRPVVFISRTLSKTEANYAVNEKELLAIVWAIKSLRNYLYGCRGLNIFTDHQPLTYSMSDKNPNAKIKRWRAFIEEFAPKFYYKPGNLNVVADALSRQVMNHLSEVGSHSEVSLTDTIKIVETSLNSFKNQLVLCKSNGNKKRSRIMFRKYIRHEIDFADEQNLIRLLKEVINPDVVNAVYCEDEHFGQVQQVLLKNFLGVRFVKTRKVAIDITNKDDQEEILINEHNRAHRNAKENCKQITRDYFFPNIRKRLVEITKTCRICLTSKYNRKPQSHIIEETPIPSRPGQILHIDIYITGKISFLTCLDKFSKFALVKRLETRTIPDIKLGLIEIINIFPTVETMICDNEPSLKSETIKTYLENKHSVKLYTVPPYHSKSNGQVERFHSTLSEIGRCIKNQQNIGDVAETILQATIKYNGSVHSVTDCKPIDVIYGNRPSNKNIEDKLKAKQTINLKYHNRKTKYRTYKPGDIVYVKVNKRLGNKLSNIYAEKIIQEDLGTTVKANGRIFHKDNIR